MFGRSWRVCLGEGSTREGKNKGDIEDMSGECIRWDSYGHIALQKLIGKVTGWGWTRLQDGFEVWISPPDVV